MTPVTFNTDLYGPVSMLPYPPLKGAKETLSFYTDVLPNYTNQVEQRSQMRATPRQMFTYQYGLKYELMQTGFNAIYSTIRNKWLIPQWFESQLISVTTGQTVFAVDTLLHDLRAGCMAMVYSKSGAWELLTISAIAGGSITCNPATLAGPCFIVPIRVGYVSGQSAMTINGYASAIKLAYAVDDVATGWTDAAPQYNGLDLYTDPYNTDGGTADATLNFQDDQYDYNTGNVGHNTPWVASQYGKNYFWEGNTPAQIRALKNYFYRRAGKLRSFMSPTFESNLRKLSTGPIGTTFKFYDDGYTSLLSATRKTLGFQLTDDTWLIRSASMPTDLGSNQAQVTLDSSLGVDSSRVKLVSFVSENRLNTDSLEFTLNNYGYFTASAAVLEISP